MAWSETPESGIKRQGSIIDALEGCLGIHGYWPNNQRDMGYFCKYLKGYGILGSLLGIWGYNAF